MNEPEEIVGMKGNTIPRKISVDYISFSAHVDYSQNSEFIDLIKAPHIVRFSSLFSSIPLRIS
jgi:cleavage and polyadenylation specificity factor subunit 3